MAPGTELRQRITDVMQSAAVQAITTRADDIAARLAMAFIEALETR